MNIFTLIFLFFDIAIIILNFNLTAIIVYTVVFLIFLVYLCILKVIIKIKYNNSKATVIKLL